jgi:hypothetical protein
MIDCPYCLTPQSFARGERCENESCGRAVPALYVQGARVKDAIFIVTFGVTKHGKSTLLGSLSFLIERLGLIAPGCYYNYLDDHTTKRLAAIQRGQQIGDPNLGATPINDTPEPLLISVKNFPTKNDTQIFVIFDLAGEVVEKVTGRISDSSQNAPLYARAIAKARTIWFVVSLFDMQKEARETGRSINNLFMTYQQVMMYFNASLRDRTVLTLFTKADKLSQVDDDNLLDVPDSVRDYLDDDSNLDIGNRGAARPPKLDFEAYTVGLRQISDELRYFTETQVSGGSAFVAMVEDSGAQIYFSIDSAQGSGEIGQEIRRVRVLDALIWSIILNDGGEDPSGSLLILPTRDAESVYEMGLHNILLERLRARNHYPQSYFSGEMRPAFNESSLPASPQLPTGRLPLIGSILDRQPTGGIAVVLVGESLPLDIDDFVHTPLEDRLLLIGTGQQVRNALVRWKYRISSAQDIEQALRDFFMHFEKKG